MIWIIAATVYIGIGVFFWGMQLKPILDGRVPVRTQLLMIFGWLPLLVADLFDDWRKK